ncbi:hypothetical protein ACTXT7_009740 [Hymenolepis weldensis]
MPNFHFPLFRSRRPNEAKKLIALYERQRRQRMAVNYDFYLFGDEPLMTQVIGLTSLSNNHIHINSRPVNCPQKEQVVRTTSPPLAVNNEHCATPKSPTEQPRTPYQLDDNFLQTINEWQRRNAAALVRVQGSSEGEESDDEYVTPAETSPVKSKVDSSVEASPDAVRKVGKTLLSIAAQKRLAEIANSEEDSGKSSVNSLPLSLQRKSILARTILRDRTQPKKPFFPLPNTFITSSSPTKTPRNSMRQDMISPVPQLSSSASAFTISSSPTVSSTSGTRTQASMRIRSEESDEGTVASPPWAAAMAAIGASSSRPVDNLMADITITNEMKRHALIVFIKAKHRNLKLVGFLKFARSFVRKVRKELLNENNGGELATTSKRKGHRQHSAHSLTAPEFVRRVHRMMDENHGKSKRDILPQIFKCLREEQ